MGGNFIMKYEWIVVGLSIICISVVEIIAIRNGINGVSLTLAIGAIAGLGGYEAKQIFTKIKEKNGLN